MLSNCVFVSLSIVLDTNTFKISLFKYTILNEVLSVEAANAFQGVIEVLSHTHNPIFFQDKAIAFAFVETLLVSKEPFISEINRHR